MYALRRVFLVSACMLVMGEYKCYELVRRARHTCNKHTHTLTCTLTLTLTFILDTLTHLLVQAGEQCVQYKGKC